MSGDRVPVPRATLGEWARRLMALEEIVPEPARAGVHAFAAEVAVASVSRVDPPAPPAPPPVVAPELAELNRMGPCRSCGQSFSPGHDVTAPGPTMRHPFMPAIGREPGVRAGA